MHVTVAEPYVETTVAEPYVETIVAEPYVGTIVAEPYVETTVAEPYVETTVAEPYVETTVAEPYVETTVAKPNMKYCYCISRSVYDSANFVNPEIYPTFGQEIGNCVQLGDPVNRIKCLVALSDSHTPINLTLLDAQVNTTLRLLKIIIVPDNELCSHPENASMVCLASDDDDREHPSIKDAHACMQEQTWPARFVCLAALYRIHLMVLGPAYYDALTTYKVLLSNLERVLLHSYGVTIGKKTDWRCAPYSSELGECRVLSSVEPIQPKQPAEFRVYPAQDVDQNGTNPLDILPIVSKCIENRIILVLIDCLTELLYTTIKVADPDYLEKTIIRHLNNLGYTLNPKTLEYSNLVRLEETKAVTNVDSIHICMQQLYLSIRAACLGLLYANDAKNFSFSEYRWRLYQLELELLGSIGLTIKMKTDWLCLLYKSDTGNTLIQQVTYECHELVRMS